MNKFWEKHDRKIMRALEVFPGFFSWSLIIFPFLGSLIIPHYVSYLVILFLIYWFYKSASLAITASIAYLKIAAASRYDWLSDSRKLDNFKKVYHLIIIVSYKEKVEKMRLTLDKLAEQDFPRERIIPVLAMEEREGPEAHEKAAILEKEFKNKFGYFWATFHPDLSGEVKGKSSNEAYAGKWAKKKLIDELGKDIDYVTISSCDADSLLPPKYFSCLTYGFLTNPNRYRRFWQAAILYYSNIWRVPAPIRVINTFGSVWRMGILVRKDRLINMSTYSLSLKMLDEAGYWDVDVIPEDYRIFFKSYFKLGGVGVEPIYLPIHVDAAESVTYWKTLVNQYEQMKRWAWGVSDDPLFIKWWILSKNTPFWDKTVHILKILEDHLLWPVNWFFVTLGATIPVILNPLFAKTVLGYNLPRISYFVLTSCLVFLAVVLYIDIKQRPPKPKEIPFWRVILLPLEFVLMPVVGFFLGALPGIDAHTRLMLGKYLEYRVTEKV